MHPVLENLKTLCTINPDYLRWAAMHYPPFSGLELTVLEHPVHRIDPSLEWMDARRLFGDNGDMSFEEYVEVLLEEDHNLGITHQQETP